MKTNQSDGLWKAARIVASVFLAGLCAQTPPAARADKPTEPTGRMVPIAPAAKGSELADNLPGKTPGVSQSKYWIGIRGHSVESPVLRTQLQLAEDLGVVVEKVVADSPAAKAGLRRHDVLLRANGKAIQGMADLQQWVHAGRAKPLQLTLIRLGQEMTVTVVPESRPEQEADQAANERIDLPWEGLGGRPESLRKLIEQLQGEGGGIRVFGPGLKSKTDKFPWNRLPSGASVTITHSGDGPLQIVVKQGDKTWQIENGDDQSLAQLPEALRPFVERLLSGPDAAPLSFQAELNDLLPGRLGVFGLGAGQPAARDPVLERMEQIEKQLQALQKKLDAAEAEVKQQR